MNPELLPWSRIHNSGILMEKACIMSFTVSPLPQPSRSCTINSTYPLIQGWERHLAPWTWTIVWPPQDYKLNISYMPKARLPLSTQICTIRPWLRAFPHMDYAHNVTLHRSRDPSSWGISKWPYTTKTLWDNAWSGTWYFRYGPSSRRLWGSLLYHLWRRYTTFFGEPSKDIKDKIVLMLWKFNKAFGTMISEGLQQRHHPQTSLHLWHKLALWISCRSTTSSQCQRWFLQQKGIL